MTLDLIELAVVIDRCLPYRACVGAGITGRSLVAIIRATPPARGLQKRQNPNRRPVLPGLSGSGPGGCARTLLRRKKCFRSVERC